MRACIKISKAFRHVLGDIIDRDSYVLSMVIIHFCIIGSLSQVPDGLVYTDEQAIFKKGRVGRLKCAFFGDPFAVYWKKGNDPATASNLVVMHGKSKSGPCLVDGSCDINATDFSLIINNVSFPDQGRYICQVSNHRGILIHNYTDVSIYGMHIMLS